jgi:hypothetical protein
MRSDVMAMLMPEGSPGAALIMRRTDGRIAFERIDARLAFAARAAEKWLRDEADADDSEIAGFVLD